MHASYQNYCSGCAPVQYGVFSVSGLQRGQTGDQVGGYADSVGGGGSGEEQGQPPVHYPGQPPEDDSQENRQPRLRGHFRGRDQHQSGEGNR